MDRFSFDARWKYAAGGLDFDYPGFVHTVLVDMRARLARLGAAGPDLSRSRWRRREQAGLVGRRRVLDSTPLYDAVATMDTVTLIRSAIRGLLKAADGELAGELRAVLRRDDDYAAAGKPACDYDDPAAREALVDALARDARALLAVLDGRSWARRWRRRRRCWPPWSARTWSKTPAGCSGSPGGSPRTGSSPPSTRTPGTGTRPPPAGSTATRATSRIDPDSEIITATAVTAG